VDEPAKSSDRRALLAAPRPKRSLPLAALAALTASNPRTHLPLASEVRPVDREARPVFAVWELTLACDLACRHCGSRAGHARPDELSKDEAMDLVRQMHALGVKEIALIGGEVYLYEGWTDVVREIRRLGMQSTVVTGGRGLTEERARTAAEAGVESVAVSVDGAESTHDRLRGVAGSYAAAVAALGRVKSAGMQVAVNTQVNRLNMRELPHVLDVLLAAGAHGWQVQLTVPVGRAADEPDVILQPYDLLLLMPLLADLKRRCDEAGVKMMPGNNVGYFGPFEHVLRSYCRSGHGDSCSAGRLTLGIEANGDIKGCPSLPTESWVGGNVRTSSLRDIWERSGPLRHMRDRTTRELWGYCAECYYGEACRAGCTWMTTALFGKPGNNPYCHHRALEMKKSGKRERVARVAEAPGLPFDRARWELHVEEERS
jgi:radical SAM protein with 4Fe4S-binding SPASM domain